jgi:hypothetical protein
MSSDTTLRGRIDGLRFHEIVALSNQADAHVRGAPGALAPSRPVQSVRDWLAIDFLHRDLQGELGGIDEVITDSRLSGAPFSVGPRKIWTFPLRKFMCGSLAAEVGPSGE